MSFEALGGQYRKMKGVNPFFGIILGPSWRPLGSSWRPLGAVLAVLAGSWGRLGMEALANYQIDVVTVVDPAKHRLEQDVRNINDLSWTFERAP